MELFLVDYDSCHAMFFHWELQNLFLICQDCICSFQFPSEILDPNSSHLRKISGQHLLHNLYTIDQNNFMTLRYLIPTVFLQSWKLVLSNNNCTTMLSCGNFPLDNNFRNVIKSFKSPLSYNLLIILSNKHVFSTYANISL